MSLSSSQETKSAIVRTGNVSSGTSSTLGLDAQEDREIVGFILDADLNADAEISGRVKAYIGTDPQPAAGQAADNRSFYVVNDFYSESDDTNGVGSQGVDLQTVWFGEGSGFEWNEDATLNIEVDNNSISDDEFNGEVVVYYREV